MLLKTLLHWAIRELYSSSTPHLDAELLLAASLQCTRAQLYCFDFSMILPSKQQEIETMVQRRKAGEPIAYLLGYQEFWSLPLEIGPAVLIPRPETELLVELLLENYANASTKIADLGTGSGAIALALASERPNWHIIATDCSLQALAIAKKNQGRIGGKNIQLRHGDWCKAFQENECFDIIVSNPPYLAHDDAHFQSELGLRFEPKLALIAEENGLKHLKEIICQARQHLLSGGELFLEHGYEQAAFVRQFFLKYDYNKVRQHKDLAGQQRVTIGKWH